MELHYLYGLLMWNFIIYMDSLYRISLFIWIPYVELRYLYGSLCGISLFIWIPYIKFHNLYGFLM